MEGVCVQWHTHSTARLFSMIGIKVTTAMKIQNTSFMSISWYCVSPTGFLQRWIILRLW